MFYLGDTSIIHRSFYADFDYARFTWYRDEFGNVRLQFAYGLDTVIF